MVVESSKWSEYAVEYAAYMGFVEAFEVVGVL
jgi:hypothetical protein